jgi:hypothetical protein
MKIAAFAVGLLAGVLIAAVVAVYGFAYSEPAWGRGGSLQVLVMAGSLVAAFCTGINALARLVSGRSPKVAASVLLGLAAAIAIVLSCWAFARVGTEAQLTVLVLACLVFPSAAALVGSRVGS